MERRSDHPIPATRLAAFGEDAGEVEGATLAGARMVDGAVLRVDAAHPHLDPTGRVAVVHNLHIIARQPVTDGYQLAA